MTLVVGAADPVRDDICRYARRLRADQVQARVEVLPGIGHADMLRPRSAVIAALADALTPLALPAQTAMKGII